jgi:cAMP-dependent protein kinase regulator
MFNSLNPQELSIVLLAMHLISFKAGDVVITEGDDGEDLYVVESGSLTCTKKMVSDSLL